MDWRLMLFVLLTLLPVVATAALLSKQGARHPRLRAYAHAWWTALLPTLLVDYRLYREFTRMDCSFLCGFAVPGLLLQMTIAGLLCGVVLSAGLTLYRRLRGNRGGRA